MEEIGRVDSFMDDTTGLNLGDDFFDDSGDIDAIFEEDGGNNGPNNNVGLIGPDNINETKLVDRLEKGKVDTKKEERSGLVDDVSLKKKRRRSDGSDGDGTATWHNESTDKAHREAMIKEIARLLKARKKTAPTKEWMHQLPHKARVLEDKLYKKAKSLEAYLNRATLKNRLREVAVTITSQYKQAITSKRLSKRGSAATVSTIGTNFSHLDSIPSIVGHPNRNSVSSSRRASQSAQNTAAASMPGANGPLVNPLPAEVAMSELTRQKAVNEELQKQILANIRHQQEMVQSIRRGSNNSQGTLPSNNNQSNTNNNVQEINLVRNQSNQMEGQNAASSNQQNRRNSQKSDAQAMAFGSAHGALTRQQSGTNNFDQMQAAMQAQFQAQQAALLGHSSNTNGNNQAVQAQMQAAFMQQAALANQFNMANAQAAMMRQASLGTNQMDPQAIAQAQAVVMGQGHASNNPQVAASGGTTNVQNAGIVNKQAGNNNISDNNPMARLPNGQHLPFDISGGNAQHLLQGMGPGNMNRQFSLTQEQMNMMLQGPNLISSTGGNDTNNLRQAMSQKEAKAGDDADALQNTSFHW